MKLTSKIIALLLICLVIFGFQGTDLRADDTEDKGNSLLRFESKEDANLKQLMDTAKEILFWDMRNFPGEDPSRPRIISYPPTIKAMRELMQKLAQIDYNKLSRSKYVDFMLLTHYLYSEMKLNEILLPHETDPQTFLPPFWEVQFEYKPNLDTRRIYGALHRLPQFKRYYDAAHQYLKQPYDEYLNNTINRMNEFLSFLNKGLVYAIMDNVGTIPNDLWMNVLYKSIKETEDFIAYLHSLEPKALKLTEEIKLIHENLRIEHRFKYRHFVQETPQQLVDFAKNEWAKIDAEMKKIAVQINENENNTTRKSDDWHAIFEDMKNEIKDEEKLLELTNKDFEEAKDFIAKSGVFPMSRRIFDIKVQKYEVKGDQQNTPYAFYAGLGHKPEQHGRYMLALPSSETPEDVRVQKIRDMYKERLRIITIHECFPGHHLQFSWAQNIQRSFMQSRLGYSTVYVEGWGLYSEQIMEELGFYDGLKGRLAMLKMRLWRCARVIIDVSRHFFGMTEEEAVKLLTDEILLEKINAEAEVRRYYTSPTQPFSYLYGWREINRLRDRMIENQKNAGKEFSLYDFHKAYLDSPYLPVYLLWATMYGEYRKPLFDLDEFMTLEKSESKQAQEK